MGRPDETLGTWTNYYLITGGAAAALTGLQFVVQTLIASDALRSLSNGDPEVGIAAFGSPTVVHFSVSLVLSAIMCAPWTDYQALRLTLALVGVASLIYAGIVYRRATRQRVYQPALEDWIWHIILPTVAYSGLLAAAALLGHESKIWFGVIAAATLLLLCIGIHNAWDTVTYLTINAVRGTTPFPPPSPSPQSERRNRRRRRK